MRGEIGTVIKNDNIKTIEDIQSISKKIDNNNPSEKKDKSVKKKVKCELSVENISLFHEGKHYEAYGFMGAHVITEKRKKGVRFTTWAPRAKNVYVVGDFSNFEVREEYRMERVSDAGLWSIFIEGIKPGEKYKYSVENNYGYHNYKADPYAFESEKRPNTASIVSENIKQNKPQIVGLRPCKENDAHKEQEYILKSFAEEKISPYRNGQEKENKQIRTENHCILPRNSLLL